MTVFFNGYCLHYCSTHIESTLLCTMAIRVVEFSNGSTKLERFLPKNQHTQRKLLNFVNWITEASEVFKNQSFNLVPPVWKLHNPYCHNVSFFLQTWIIWCRIHFIEWITIIEVVGAKFSRVFFYKCGTNLLKKVFVGIQ